MGRAPVTTAGQGPARQRHGDRLTGVDVAFLEVESPTLHMHVGGLFIFDPPEEDPAAFTFSRFLALVRSRLHLVPRYRQHLVYPALGVGNPIWADDPEFDLAYHVRHAALPAPGTTAQLNEYCTRILSRQLDRERPLWELYVIEGLEHGRVAILGKSHHAMVDGLAGMDIATVMLEVTSDQPEIPAPQPWQPAATPSGADLALDQVVRLATTPSEVIDSLQRMRHAPLKTARKVATVGRGVAKVVRSNVIRPAPRSLLNQPPGTHRRFAIQRVALDDVKFIKNAFGTTVNDVVLAIVADAVGGFLRDRGARTDGLWLRAMVPVSTRSGSEEHQLGNRVVTSFVDLPMFEMDAVERLRVCHDAMGDVLASHAPVGAGFLIGLGDFAPPTIHAMAARAAVNSRLFNFLVTNVPGPQAPIYCLGARLLGAFPFTPLAANHAFGVGVISIDGWMNFGFTADYDALPDVESITHHLVSAVSDLLRSARAADRRHGRSWSPRTGSEADVITPQLTGVPSTKAPFDV